ncbi:MAG: ACT domain-containing protein, partial [Pseudomonadota bacterium]
FSIKLLGLAQLHDQGLEQWVRPCMVPRETLIGSLPGVTNAVVAEGDFIGACSFTGPGAGAGPTASAILADVLDLARGALRPLFGRPASGLSAAPRLAQSEEHSPYYLRAMLHDRPGALAALATSLGESGISIHRMRQYGRGEASVPVVIVTHETERKAVDLALSRIAALEVSAAAPVALGIEEV